MNNDVVKFDDLYSSGILAPVPTALVNNLTQAKRGEASLHSIITTDKSGMTVRKFPLANIYSGRVTSISKNLIEFPKNTRYGVDKYLTVELDNGLTVYVPAKQAGLKQPQHISEMRGRMRSVVIESFLQKGHSEDGNPAPVIAFGSIQSAEYQIGATLMADLVHNPEAFINHEREAIISAIDTRNDRITVTLTPEATNSGYIDMLMDKDDIDYAYFWQNVNDLKGIERGNTITIKLKNIIEEEINDKKNGLQGTYYRLIGNHIDTIGVRTPEQFLTEKIATHAQFRAYVYNILPNNGITVEIAPGFRVQTTTSPRIVSRISNHFDRSDVKSHIPVYVEFNNTIHSLSDLNGVKRPVMIVDIDRDYHNSQMATSLGFTQMPSDEEIKMAKDILRAVEKKRKNNKLSSSIKKHHYSIRKGK